MEKRKITLDRKHINSEYIRGKQNFNQVLKEYQVLKPPLWKSAWFYGPIGVATLTIAVSIGKLNSNNVRNIDDHNITLAYQSPIETPDIERKVSAPEMVKEQHEEPETPEKTTTPINREEVPVPALQSSEEVVIQEKINPPVIIETAVIKRKEEISVAKATVTMPMIAGVFTGRIRIDRFCEAPIVACNDGSTVTSYTISYFNGKKDVEREIAGNQIPDDLCGMLRTYNMNQMIFLTKIIALKPNGEEHLLTSMNLIPSH